MIAHVVSVVLVDGTLLIVKHFHEVEQTRVLLRLCIALVAPVPLGLLVQHHEPRLMDRGEKAW